MGYMAYEDLSLKVGFASATPGIYVDLRPPLRNNVLQVPISRGHLPGHVPLLAERSQEYPVSSM